MSKQQRGHRPLNLHERELISQIESCSEHCADLCVLIPSASGRVFGLNFRSDFSLTRISPRNPLPSAVSTSPTLISRAMLVWPHGNRR